MELKNRFPSWNGRHRNLAILLVLPLILGLLEIRTATAAPVTASDAQKAIGKLISGKKRPLNAKIGNTVRKTETFYDSDGEPIYHVVYLSASGTANQGFLIVSGEDQVQPIVAFCSGTQFNPSPNNPLGAMVSEDLPQRVSDIRKAKASVLKASQPARHAKQQWDNLLAAAKASASGDTSADTASATVDSGTSTLSDIRVSPLVSSKWDQENVGTSYCYNYYTPNHYLSGCVATAMSQLIRYHKFPTQPVGIKAFTVTVDGSAVRLNLRGGNGLGGAYDWSNMTLVPTANATTTERQAIGALLYDAGLSVNMEYAGDASGAYTFDVAAALVSTFQYANAKAAYNYEYDISAILPNIINSNLDASYPVVLGITGSAGGHAIVCDGYGYYSGTLYHHLNMGWSGYDDAWYALPNINAVGAPFSVIKSCIYNAFPSGSGEIVSGRVTDAWSLPVEGAVVTATTSRGSTYTATTNSNGIYALTKLSSSTGYTININKTGFAFNDRSVATGTSITLSSTAGNLAGVDFIAEASGTTSNDNFANAWTMTGESWASADNNSNMTHEIGEQVGVIAAWGSHSAWWKWTAPSSWPSAQSVYVTTAGSTFDTIMESYTGSIIYKLVVVARNDDENLRNNVLTSAFSFNANPGTTYYFAVDGKNGGAGSIQLTLTGPSTVTATASPSIAGKTSGSGLYSRGSWATLTATANQGYDFASWTQDSVVMSTSSTYTFLPTHTSTLLANFTQTPWNAWRTSNFTTNELTNTAVSGALQSPDGDGICNLIKYAFRLNRRNPNRSVLPAVSTQGGLSITYAKNLAANDLTYTVEVSSDLKTWYSGTGFTSTPVEIGSTEATKTYRVFDLTGTAHYIRVRITQN